MRLPIFLSSTVLIATAILGINNSVYGQCKGGYCPVPNAYFDQNAPSAYGYNQNPNWQTSQNPNWQGNPYWQGNQNPNWQGNQSPDWRNDNGARANSNQSYYQGSNNTYSRNNTNSAGNDQAVPNPNISYRGENGQDFYYQNLNTNQAVNDQNTPADKLIQNKVNDTLKNNYLKKNFNTVNARVYNGNVTLTGTVESEQDRQDVEKRARDVQGVHNVNDQLQVTTQTSFNDTTYSNQTAVAGDSTSNSTDTTTTVTDEDLQKQIDDSLKNNYVKKNFDTVIVTVSDGVVTLTGIVDTDKDRQDIRERLQKIKGIANINDRLQITGSKTSYNSYKKPAYAR